MSEEQKKSENRSNPTTDEFRAFVKSGWAPRTATRPERAEVAAYAAARRDAVSAAFPGERLVIPAGGLKVRSNDTDYAFRPHSAFAHLTGFGGDQEPDAVLVLEPLPDGGHDAVLYFKPWGGRDSDEFFGDTRYGEFWVGGRPTLEDIEAEFGLTARNIDEFADAVAKDAGQVGIRVVREADRDVAEQVEQARASASEETTSADELQAQVEADDELSRFLSTLRLVKDEWEIAQMRLAIAATQEGFEAVIAQLQEAVRRAVASGGSRASSASTPGTRATASGTTRSALSVTTRRRCTGPGTPATSRTASCCSSTPGSRSTRSTPLTSPARCRSTGRSPRPSARSTTRCMRRSRRPWRPSSRA